jgi:hypothetical protein
MPNLLYIKATPVSHNIIIILTSYLHQFENYPRYIRINKKLHGSGCDVVFILIIHLHYRFMVQIHCGIVEDSLLT